MKSIIVILIAITMVSVVGPVSAQPAAGTITFSISPATTDNSGDIRLWLPYPLSDGAQKITNIRIDGNHDHMSVYRDVDSSATFLYARWQTVPARPWLTLRCHVSPRNRKIVDIIDSRQPIPVEVGPYLNATKWVPADDERIKALAADITVSNAGILENARRVYDWVVDNTYRDPDVKACGLAIPGRTLFTCKGGGKCADISAVFVTLARAAGIPARDVYGIRLIDPEKTDITDGFHCWAEFYLPGTGWIPVDPADVRKMMLVHDLSLERAAYWREFFWAGDDFFRIVLAKDARGVMLEPPQQGGPLNYFMYPYAEADGKALPYDDPDSFQYTVHFQAD